VADRVCGRLRLNVNRDQTSPAGAFTVRPYASEADLLQMQEFLMESRAVSGDWRFPHVGELTWDFFMVACHLHPAGHIRLWHDAAGRLSAYAMLGEDPSFSCWVAPEHEWAGVEAEALSWAEERLAELRRQDPRGWGGRLAAGARRDDERRIAFLEKRGFRYVGEFAEVNMLRRLDGPLPEAPLPAGCRVRGMEEVGRVTGRARAQREVWQPWTVGRVGDEDYAAFMRLPGYRPELDVVAVLADGVVASYANCWVDASNRIGDFGPVGTRPAYRRRGLARAVLVEGLRQMRAAGMDRACVSTGVSNTVARRLYESVGFRVVNEFLDFAKPVG